MNLVKRKKEYDKLDWAVRGSMLFFVFFFSGVYAFVFYGMALLIYSRENPVYFIFPSFGTWWIPSLFLGIISSVFPTQYIFRSLLGKRRYNELQLYVAGKDGIRRKSRKRWIKLFYVLSFITILASIIIFPLMFDCYTKIFQDKIVVNQLCKLSEKIYDFNDVAELRHILSVLEKNKIYKRTFHEIAFKDGYTLSFYRNWLNKDFNQQAEILQFISEKSHLPITIINPAVKTQQK